MLSCLKNWENCDPYAAEEFDKNIYSILADEADVTLEVFIQAKAMILLDGYEGPRDPECWQALGITLSLSEAKDIIEKAKGYRFEDIEYNNPDVEQWCGCNLDEDSCNHTNDTICGDRIHQEVWSWYSRIYGGK